MADSGTADRQDLDTPFHAGERAVQQRLGVSEVEQWAQKMVRPFMPQQHRDFYEALPFVVVAARDAKRRPWVTLLAGGPGFIRTRDDRALTIDAQPVAGDGLHGELGEGSDVGLLGLDFATRRRNRMNGRVLRGTTTSVELKVMQAFGNCPQYITERSWTRVEPTQSAPAPPRPSLSPKAEAWIRAADTFFVGTGIEGDSDDPRVGMDASHRGGPAGFVVVEDDRTLVFPDYAGNNHFNTIGNLVLDSRIGLTFVDFGSGSLLQITGRAHIDWDSETVQRFAGARRLVRVDIEEVRELEAALPLRWAAREEDVQDLVVIDRIRESDDVVSFVLATDRGSIHPFEAGQSLPILVPVPGGPPVGRNYSLSGDPDDDVYRISVKRQPQGLVSSYLHDHIKIGDRIQAGKPAGEFVLQSDGPVVLISAGTGVTPMLSMLHVLSRRSGAHRVTFIHAARDGRHHVFDEEVRRLRARTSTIDVHVAYSRPLPEDRGHDSVGRISGELIERIAGRLDADFYVCGPTPFMTDVIRELWALGVNPDRTFAETFAAS